VVKSFISCGAAVGLFLLYAVSANALPQYAAKEHKTCGYCHTSSSGGGSLTPRGVYYRTHNHSFDGYDEEKVMGEGQSASPTMKLAWKMDGPDSAAQITSVTMPDERAPRLVSLIGAGTISLYKPLQFGLPVDYSQDAGANVAPIFVGNFMSSPPPILVFSGGWIGRDASGFSKKDAAGLSKLIGMASTVSGDNGVILAGKPLNVLKVDPGESSGVTNWLNLSDKADMQKILFTAIYPPKKDTDPKDKPSPVIMEGILRPGGKGAPFHWVLKQDEKSAHLQIFAAGDLQNGNTPDAKPVWQSDAIPGQALSASYMQDPKNGEKSGFLVLASPSPDSSKRMMYFFALNGTAN
jgi:hypothetical protein